MVEVVVNQNDGFVSITASGGETTLAGDFPIYEKAHVTIKRTRSGTITTGVLNTDYTIADNQLEVTAGFTAALAGTWTPATAGDVYTLLQDVPESRTTDFTAAGDFFAATLNEQLDLQTQMIQQLRRDVDKSARLPDTSTLTELFLPTPQAAKLLQWNDGGDGLQNVVAADLNLVTVSSFIATVLDDTTAADARTTLVALSSAVGAVPLTSLATQAANTFVANASASTATPTASVALSASNLAGRGSTGNLAAISLGSGLSMSGTTMSATGITLGTPVAATSGTSIDFTGIPSGVKQITINFNGVSTNGTDNWLIQLGDAGGVEVTGYLTGSYNVTGGGTGSSTVGFLLLIASAAAVGHGSVTLNLENSSTNTWCGDGNIFTSDTYRQIFTSGSKPLSATLDRVRITTTGGTQTFDAGEINISYQ